MSMASTLLTALLVLASLQVTAVAGASDGDVHCQEVAAASAPAPVAVSAAERDALSSLQASSQQLETAKGGEVSGHETEIILGIIGAIILILWLVI